MKANNQLELYDLKMFYKEPAEYNFKDLCILHYRQLIGDIILDFKVPTIVQIAVKRFGMDKLILLNYSERQVREYLTAELTAEQKEYLIRKINFTRGQFYTLKEVIEHLETVYYQLDIFIEPKATDIQLYYEVIIKNKLIDGQNLTGFYVICPRNYAPAPIKKKKKRRKITNIE